MSLKSYFPDQFDQIKTFLLSGEKEVVRCIRIDAEMKQMFTKALAKLDEDPDFPHMLLDHDGAFEDPTGYFDGLLARLRREYEQHAEALAEAGVKFEDPLGASSEMRAPHRFVLYASAMADALPDDMGSLVFLMDPEAVDDQPNYRRAMAFLAEKTTSDWLKFLVLDERQDPPLDGLEEECDRIGAQTFYLSPEEIERRASEDVKSEGTLDAAEKRQYLGLVAGFSFANKRYDEAVRLQRQWGTEAKKHGTPVEVANAYFNLGNTLLAKGDYGDATNTFCRACEVCLENELNAMAPMVYTNLGVSLHRQGKFEEAFASLRVARDTFKAQNVRPGEAHVVDCLARMYAEDGRNEEAEKAWRYALSLYDGITAGVFNDVRDGGRSDILAKMEWFFEDTGQSDKLRELQAAGGGDGR